MAPLAVQSLQLVRLVETLKTLPYSDIFRDQCWFQRALSSRVARWKIGYIVDIFAEKRVSGFDRVEKLGRAIRRSSRICSFVCGGWGVLCLRWRSRRSHVENLKTPTSICHGSLCVWPKFSHIYQYPRIVTVLISAASLICWPGRTCQSSSVLQDAWLDKVNKQVLNGFRQSERHGLSIPSFSSSLAIPLDWSKTRWIIARW